MCQNSKLFGKVEFWTHEKLYHVTNIIRCHIIQWNPIHVSLILTDVNTDEAHIFSISIKNNRNNISLTTFMIRALTGLLVYFYTISHLTQLLRVYSVPWYVMNYIVKIVIPILLWISEMFWGPEIYVEFNVLAIFYFYCTFYRIFIDFW